MLTINECIKQSGHSKSHTAQAKFSHFAVCLMIILHALTEMQEDLPIVLLHTQLVFVEKFLVLLLFDLCHDILSFL